MLTYKLWVKDQKIEVCEKFVKSLLTLRSETWTKPSDHINHININGNWIEYGDTKTIAKLIKFV